MCSSIALDVARRDPVFERPVVAFGIVYHHPLSWLGIEVQMIVGKVKFNAAEPVRFRMGGSIVEVLVAVEDQVDRVAVFEEMGTVFGPAEVLVALDGGDETGDGGGVVGQEAVEFVDEVEVDHLYHFRPRKS